MVVDGAVVASVTTAAVGLADGGGVASATTDALVVVVSANVEVVVLASAASSLPLLVTEHAVAANAKANNKCGISRAENRRMVEGFVMEREFRARALALRAPQQYPPRPAKFQRMRRVVSIVISAVLCRKAEFVDAVEHSLAFAVDGGRVAMSSMHDGLIRERQ